MEVTAFLEGQNQDLKERNFSENKLEAKASPSSREARSQVLFSGTVLLRL